MKVAIPTKIEILEKATEMFHSDTGLFITPEEEELKEAGYYNLAKNELMQGDNAEAISYAEQLANELGFRLIPENQHSDIIYYQLKCEKLREKLKQTQNQPKPQPQKTLTLKQVEAIKPQPEPKTVKTEFNEKVSVCTSIKGKLRDIVAIFKLVGEICYLKLSG